MQRPKLKNILIVFSIAVISLALALYAYLYFAQEGLIFKPQNTGRDVYRIRAGYPAAEAVSVRTSDNIVLRGWFLKNPEMEKAPMLVYFAGNADEASEFLSDSVWIKGWSLLLMNYRGYGLSEGRPAEKDLFNDAVLVYDLFSRRNDVDASKIVALGRSLGTGVAVYLAHERPLKGVILVSPYDSIKSVAQEIHPYAPVSLLIKHPFDALSLAPAVKTTLLAFVAADDDTIRPHHSMRLIKSWGGKSIVKIIDGAGHNSILESGEYRKGVQGFLRGLE